ncbi:hypothetical protein Ade02nite_42200 [Paractinoplanes deccanensis]|uniref:Uncharacterized protein n=1 Tax=Paractinoplanes deccanensis TaxID=113561 RepID=A0ABQ3Y6F3_9ACTN|nr:hypothetical protein Ade02nite_42200 [Actinoplanes deccanensis]
MSALVPPHAGVQELALFASTKASAKSVIPVLAWMALMFVLVLVTSRYGATGGVLVLTADALPADVLPPAAPGASVEADGVVTTALVAGLASAASLALQPAASISAAAVRQTSERRIGFMPEILAFIPVIDA